ncbi:hypothetical protein GCM10010912_36990 [Paenibacillus albidus]|uniref:Uncharacterized protein n=1 Tax=Paenibacillus albidus TaxID=2041023 RepID=A0A917FJZ7_9BACL|nr:hypothetical protein [Paenibacillus albidus]GGF88313.1 hypothetical protein GCM10010912_36990 [Paenibacillus albidus]
MADRGYVGSERNESEPKLKEKFIQGKNKLAKKESIPVEKVSEAYGYDGSRQEKRP